jgi:hypothetical protein
MIRSPDSGFVAAVFPRFVAPGRASAARLLLRVTDRESPFAERRVLPQDVGLAGVRIVAEEAAAALLPSDVDGVQVPPAVAEAGIPVPRVDHFRIVALEAERVGIGIERRVGAVGKGLCQKGAAVEGVGVVADGAIVLDGWMDGLGASEEPAEAGDPAPLERDRPVVAAEAQLGRFLLPERAVVGGVGPVAVQAVLMASLNGALGDVVASEAEVGNRLEEEPSLPGVVRLVAAVAERLLVRRVHRAALLQIVAGEAELGGAGRRRERGGRLLFMARVAHRIDDGGVDRFPGGEARMAARLQAGPLERGLLVDGVKGAGCEAGGERQPDPEEEGNS